MEQCPICGKSVNQAATGRPPKFCSTTCRKRAHRASRGGTVRNPVRTPVPIPEGLVTALTDDFRYRQYMGLLKRHNLSEVESQMKGPRIDKGPDFETPMPDRSGKLRPLVDDHVSSRVNVSPPSIVKRILKEARNHGWRKASAFKQSHREKDTEPIFGTVRLVRDVEEMAVLRFKQNEKSVMWEYMPGESHALIRRKTLPIAGESLSLQITPERFEELRQMQNWSEPRHKCGDKCRLCGIG